MADTVLIVDDSASVRAALRAYLGGAGGWPTVLTAADAAGGVELAAIESPQAIVLDNRMPGGDGIDVLARLRRTCPDARIVMHTSEADRTLRDRAAALGADAVVVKGRPLQELAELLAGELVERG